MAAAAPSNPARADPSAQSDKAKTESRRVIPGNFSYTTSAGVLAKVIQKLIISERPPQFTTDFLGSVLGSTGGSSRPIIPILKKTGILRPDGVPTEIYGQFQSETKRPQAALEALKTGWPELFRRNQYVHRLERKATEDLFVEITGLKRDDPTLRAIISTYYVFRDYAKDATGTDETPVTSEVIGGSQAPEPREEGGHSHIGLKLGLVNQVSIILPETTDINVYNAIFKSLRENLLN